MIEFKNNFELCDIWRLRNSRIKRITLGKNIGLALFNVDSIFFVSNVLEEYLQNSALASFCSDHSLVLFAIDIIKEGQGGNRLWKFSCSQLSNKKLVRNMKNYISTTKFFLNGNI